MIRFLIYWIEAQVVCFLMIIKVAITGKGRFFDITNYLTNSFQAKYSITSTSHMVNTKPTMFIVNHRAWSDFCIDSAMLGGPSYLSRFAVALGLPLPVLIAWVCTSIWLFERKGGISREWFTDFFRVNLALRPDSSVIVYPEGTRNTKKEPRPLKTGVFECAWNLKLPVQAVVTINKEICVNEKTLQFVSGVQLRSHVSKVIYPSEYKDKEDFFEGCKSLFELTWKNAYDEDIPSKPVIKLPLPGAEGIPKDEPILPSRLLIVRIILAFLLLAMYYTCKYVIKILMNV